MKFLILILFLFVGHASAEELKFSLTMDRLPAKQLVMLYYDQCEKRGLVIDPTLENVDQEITIKTPSLSCTETKKVILKSLSYLSIVLIKQSSFDVLTKLKLDEADHSEWDNFVYLPKFRDPLELSNLSQFVIHKGAYAHQRRGVELQLSPGAQSVPETQSNGASITSKSIDKLVFHGPQTEIEALRDLLQKLDVPYPQVEIQASVFEFQSGKAQSDAVTAALNLFSSKIGVAVNTLPVQNASSLKFSFANLSAALQVLDNDSRFKYISRPKVLVKDGEQVSFTAGQDVRVSGQTVVSSTGQATQSITTVTAGVTFTATPYIRGDVVDVTFHQLVSDFAKSPNENISIVRRDLSSRLQMQPGYVYIVGGLKTNKSSKTKSSFLGGPVGHNSDESDTEVLLLISVLPDDFKSGII